MTQFYVTLEYKKIMMSNKHKYESDHFIRLIECETDVLPVQKLPWWPSPNGPSTNIVG